MSTLTISQLFNPQPSGVGNAPNPPSGSWLSTILSLAANPGQGLQPLTTTAWQSGGMARTILAILAALCSSQDVTISLLAQGGFLDFAATGTVTYTSPNGITVTAPVTPDPSLPSQNPTGIPGWLDVLADSVYGVQRIGAQSAATTLSIANTTAATYGPYLAGTYHSENPTTGATYTNTASVTITPSTSFTVTAATNANPIVVTTSAPHGLANGATVYITGVLGNLNANGFWSIAGVTASTFQLVGSVGSGAYTSGGTVYACTTVTISADLPGPGGSAGIRTITQAVTANPGVLVSNLSAAFGQGYESNTALAARCRAKLAALSPNGPHGAYVYFALTAATILAAQTPPVQLSSPITKALRTANTVTGIVTTTIANATPASMTTGQPVVPGVSNLAVSGATNASPIVVTTASAHGLSNGNYVTITGVLGNTNANGTWVIASAAGSTLSLVGSSGNAAYTGGGVVEGGDLGEVDSVIQANAVPDVVTAITQSALAWAVAVVGTVQVPQAQATAYATAVQVALAAFFAALPIGGGASSTPLSIDDVIGVLYAAGQVAGGASYVVAVTGVTLNGSSSDQSFPSSISVAVLSPTPAITVQGV